MRHGIVLPGRSANIRHFAEAALTLRSSAGDGAGAPSGAPRPCGGLRHHYHPLEFATHAQHLEAWAGAGGGEHLHPKGAGVAPFSSALVAQAAEAASLPPGVLNLLQGTGAGTGAALIDRPELARISFTGSTATGRAIAAAMGRLVPCSLELGEIALLSCSRAPISTWRRAPAPWMYRNATQVCLAGTRLLIHEGIFEAFLECMGHYVAQLTVGDPREAATEVGPLIHPRQLPG